MKRWAWVVVALYSGILLLLTWPLAKICFLNPKEALQPQMLFTSWQYWAWLAALALNQYILLVIPVAASTARPIAKRSVVFLTVATGLMMGLLAAGLVSALVETLTKGTVASWIFWAALLSAWVLWGFVFLRWFRKLEPQNLLEKQCRYLFTGSILELLVAVPTHIIARHRNYCCAGFDTFIGIACGLAVMLFSFGPGVFFLFVKRWKERHPHQNQ